MAGSAAAEMGAGATAGALKGRGKEWGSANRRGGMHWYGYVDTMAGALHVMRTGKEGGGEE